MKYFLCFHFLKYITSLLRGKSYYGDFIKTLIIGFMCYIIGFVIVVLQIIVSISMSMDVDSIAMFYYLILMPIVFTTNNGGIFYITFDNKIFLKVINYKNYNLNR